ncbi:MAG: T9SS type A sorting domain-containing protein, partial [Candidatus Marinimicrobia bacterium]|nr:T9SS type A sorting domain-containing protein [Candidatus Neomarinimicrobiota bacterium]
VGGLVGYNYNSSTVTNSYSTKSVSSYYSVGGLVGRNNLSTVINSYSTGSVSGDDYVGGLVGSNYSSTISNSYSIGSVNGSGSDFGGLVGTNYSSSTVSNSFWDQERSGQSSSAGGTGKMTANMKNVATYTDTSTSIGLYNAWDFIDNPNDDNQNNDIWEIDTYNDGYPYLTWQDTTYTILNTLPAISSLQDTISFKNDTTATLNIWNIAEDNETVDSLLNYVFTSSTDSVITSYNDTTGILTLSSNVDYVGISQLIIEVSDNYGTVKDSLLVNITGILGNQIPKEFSLKQNYPNPFNTKTTISYQLPKSSNVQLAIYNVLGQKVKMLVNEKQDAGAYQIVLNGSNLASGIYFYRLQTDQGFSKTRKLVLLK